MLVVNATLINWIEGPSIKGDGAIRIEGSRISDVGASAVLRARYPEEEHLDARGMVVMPGLICGHTHLSRALARGEWPGGPRQDTLDHVRQMLWWKLDAALGYDEMRYAALCGCLEAIRHGVTTLFDQHTSSSAIPFSLDAIAEAVLQSGLRAGLCYAVSDRQGLVSARRAIQENARFARRSRHEPLLAASMGLEASRYVSDESLRAAVGAAALCDVGFHASVAESRLDVRESRHQRGYGPIERLRRYGALGPRTILAHGVHIENDPMSTLSRSNSTVVHLPKSNMRHAVGRAPVVEMLDRGIQVGIGSDGLGCDMLGEMEAAYLLQCHSGDRLDPVDEAPFGRLGLVHNARMASRVFRDRLGELAPGALADLVLVVHHPTAPLRTDNLYRHMVLNPTNWYVDTVLVNGRVLMRHGQLTTLDQSAIYARTRALATALWSRIG